MQAVKEVVTRREFRASLERNALSDLLTDIRRVAAHERVYRRELR